MTSSSERPDAWHEEGPLDLRVGGVPEHFNLPWHLAAESGALSDGRVEVHWHDQPGGTGQMTAALAAGDLDVIVALTEGLVAAIAGGLPARMVRLYTTSPLQWGVHVAGRSSLESTGLDGVRFAISRLGSGSHLMAHVLADRLGLRLDGDSFVAVGDLDGARAALAGGDAEVFLWDRFMTSPLVEAGEFRRIDVQPTPWPAFVVAASDALLAQPEARSVLDGVLTAVAREATAFSGLASASTMISDRYGLSPTEADAWLEVTSFATATTVEPEMVAAVENRLVELGIVDHARGAPHYLP